MDVSTKVIDIVKNENIATSYPISDFFTKDSNCPTYDFSSCTFGPNSKEFAQCSAITIAADGTSLHVDF